MNSEVSVSGSLRNRLAMTLIGGITVLTVLLFFIIRLYAAQIAQQSQDSILRASVTSMLDAATIRDDVVVMDIPYSTFSMLGTPEDDRIFYVIYQDKNILSGYDDLELPEEAINITALQETANVGSASFRSIEFMGVPVRQVISSRVMSGRDTPIRITASIAQTRDNLAVTLHDISRNAAAIVAGFFVLAVIFSTWAASTAIAPLKRLTDSVARRGPEDLSPVIKPVPTEMVPLVSSLNHFMQRLAKSLNQSEEFIAEAAHRVRTPIATVRSHAEMTLQRVDKEENRNALRAMIRAIDETSRAAGQLLDHAMITFRASQLASEEIDLVELVREMVRGLMPIAEMKDIELVLKADSLVIINGDPILIQNAIRNMIDNALKYSPRESVIRIDVVNQPNPSVVVKDSGPGFFKDEKINLTDRFARGRNSIGTIGSGLGLTITNDVANAHNGSLDMSNNIEGGACVTLSF